MQIRFQNVSFVYNESTPFKTVALNNINLDLFENNVTAIVGKTGSGKSTLTELINKLLTPTEGSVIIDNLENSKKVKVHGKNIQEYRKNIGFLFQFSENQLFEETVLKDVMFGVKSFYPKTNNPEILAKDALNQVGLDSSFYNRSPFDLSGGEKKRAAIAGVLAYHPKLLILDEPTAGLDAKGKKTIMDLFMKIHHQGVAIILVTHDMDVVLKYTDQMVILDEGKIKKIGKPNDIFHEYVEQYQLETPKIFQFVHELRSKGLLINENNIKDIPTLIKEIKAHG